MSIDPDIYTAAMAEYPKKDVDGWSMTLHLAQNVLEIGNENGIFASIPLTPAILAMTPEELDSTYLEAAILTSRGLRTSYGNKNNEDMNPTVREMRKFNRDRNAKKVK